MPFLTGLPITERGIKPYIAKLKEVYLSRQSALSFDLNINAENIESHAATLVATDAVIAASIADHLNKVGGTSARPVSLFGEDICTRALGTKVLKGENAILEELNSEIYGTIYADPILLGQVKDDHISKIELPQYAISSRIGATAEKEYIGSDFREIGKTTA